MGETGSNLDTNILTLLYNIERDKEKGSSDSEESHISDREHYTQKLWNYFQYAAVAISQLYKNCEIYLPQNGDEQLWLPFQNASLAITSLYKEAIDSQKKRFELGFRLGQKKRNKEIITWLSHYYQPTRRNNRIRKDDLLTYLNHLDRKSCGLNTKSSSLSPQRFYSSPRGSYISSSPSPSPNSVYNNRVKHPPQCNKDNTKNMPPNDVGNDNKSESKTSTNEDVDLQTFIQALNMHGLNGAMSQFTMTSSPARSTSLEKVSSEPQLSPTTPTTLPTATKQITSVETSCNHPSPNVAREQSSEYNALPTLIRKRYLNSLHEATPKRLKYNHK